MSTKVSSGLALTSDFYLRSFYQANTNATKASHRKKYSSFELDYEDSRALRRGSKKVSSFSYNEDSGENSEGVINSVKAYIKTFNNTIESASKDPSMKRYANQLKALSNKYEDQLSAVGITVEKNGSLTVNEGLLSAVDIEKVGKIFGEESDFAKTSASVSRKMNNTARDQIYANLTGNGNKINIVL